MPNDEPMAEPPNQNDAQRRATANQRWAAASRLFTEGKWAAAAQALRTAVALDSENAALWSDLGAAEQYHGDLAAASAAYERSLALQPNNPPTQANLGFLLVQQGQPQQCLDLLRPLLESANSTAQIWAAAGHAYRALDNLERAVASFHNALALAPGDAEARHNLAISLRAAWQLAEAKAVTRSLLESDPKHASAWYTLGHLEQATGRIDEAIDAFLRSVQLSPQPSRHSTLLTAIQYVEQIEPATLLAAHREWDAIHTRSVTPLPPPVTRPDIDRKLRIGFICSQFGQHPVGFLALPAIASLDKSRCTVVCYSGRSVEDDYTIRFRTAADIWRVTTELSAEQLAAQIRTDEIDILIDLMGHTSPALLAFAYRPAPLQISWLGYVGTTGMQTTDCLLADAHHILPGEEAFYTEQILRMPHGYACYGPPDYAPEVNELPALKSGNVSFGCFNNPAKFSPGILQAWAEILRRVPNSRLLLKYFGLDDRETQQLFMAHFAAANIDPTRITFEGGTAHSQTLDAYQRVDLALDTQPYSGGLTTCEALWMGVPVITYPGKTFAGRHSTSHLTNAGFGQFIAENRARYIDLAVNWANRLNELSRIRRGMREQIRQSTLCDAPRFAGDLLAVLREAWIKTTSTRNT